MANKLVYVAISSNGEFYSTYEGAIVKMSEPHDYYFYEEGERYEWTPAMLVIEDRKD